MPKNGPSPGDAAYKSPWLHAHYDKLASIRTGSAGISLIDLEGTGEHALLVADLEQKLRVFKGTRQTSEHPLVDEPVAVCGFYMDEKKPRVPAVGVACGPHVFVYRNLRPYFKFTAPAVELDREELAIWKEAKEQSAGVEDRSRRIDAAVEVRTKLKASHDAGTKLSARSLAILPMEDLEQLAAHVERVCSYPLKQESMITCMSSLPKSIDEPDAMCSLVIGTESCQLIVLDPLAATKLCQVQLPAVPMMIRVSGCYDVDWRCVVACRNARLYTVSFGEHRGTAVIRKPHIELETQICGLLRVEKEIYVATADSTVHCFLQKGRKQFSLRMPAPVTNLELLTIRKSRTVNIVLVALATGEIRGYRGKDLVDVIRVGEPINAMATGAYGREDNTLLVVTRSGALLVKMLPRSTTFDDDGKDGHAGPPPEQDIPLAIPKKTRMYVELEQRERECSAAMHRQFQKDLVRLRLTTSRAYAQLLNTGELVEGKTGADATVNLSAHVRGLGPFFHIIIELRASGTTPLLGVPVVVVFNQAQYRMPRSLATVPVLIPGVAVRVLFEIECIDENATTDGVTISVLSPNPEDVAPLVASTLTMPQSELLE